MRGTRSDTPAEQLIGDRPGERGKLRDRRRAVVPAAEHRDNVAHGGVRNIGHIQHAHVHADAPDLLYALPAQQHLELSGKAALQAVRVPDGEHRERAVALRRPCASVADRVALLVMRDRAHAAFERHDRRERKPPRLLSG